MAIPRIPRNNASNRLGDRLVIINDRTGPDDGIEFEKDDIQLPIKQRLADYLATQTAQTGNDIAIQTGYTEVSTHDSAGNVADLSDPSAGGQESFTGDIQSGGPKGTNAVTSFNKESKSGQLDTTNDPFQIKKGKENSNAPTIGQILRQINEQGSQSPFAKRMDHVLFDNNRFNEGKPYTPRGGIPDVSTNTATSVGSSGNASVTEDNSNLGSLPVQQQFGVHAPRKFPTAESDKDSVIVKLADMKNVGLLTMLQASGEYYIPNNPNDAAQQLAARGTTMVPGLARVGQKVSFSRTTPLKILRDVNPSFNKPTLDNNISNTADVLTYGNVNNWMAPFAGLTDTAGIACAGILIVVVGGLLKALAASLSSDANQSRFAGGVNPTLSDRRKRLGSWLGKANEVDAFRNSLINLDVYQTRHSFAACVDRGISIFFDVPRDTSAPLPGPGTLNRVIATHGYYNTVLRTVVRSTTDFFLNALATVVNPSGVSNINDVTVLGNPLGLFSMIDKLNSSALFKFVNILASIGDTALSHEEDGFEVDTNGTINAYISDIDLIPDLYNQDDNFFDNSDIPNPAALVAKSRLSDQFNGTLAWSQGSVKSMFLLPGAVLKGVATYIGGSDQGNNMDTVLGDLKSAGHVVAGDDSNLTRIGADKVKQMEDYLEADYMPFYFHDLRTNEIVSFHAFLEDVSDNYDAEYTEMEGYGRVGSVPIWKNTKRAISMTFRIVATSPKDFDHMWYKINKLVTLLYPQYTEGRMVGTGQNKFIQPFSQIPAASPMIRLRLGDLFKTNYSKLAVARLFGIDSSNFSLEGLDSQGNYRYQAELRNNRRQVAKRMQSGQYEQGERALLRASYTPGHGRQQKGYPRTQQSPSDTSSRTRMGRQQTLPLPDSFNTVNGQSLSSAGIDRQGRPLINAYETRVLIVERLEANGLSAGNQTTARGTNQIFLYKVRPVTPASGEDGTYIVTQSDLTSLPEEITRIALNQNSSSNQQADPNQPPANTPEAIRTFFNDDPNSDSSNPILRSFATTKGRGLAGFIKNMKFDWADARWVTDRFNARAPMSMKVVFDFLPVHDINPGLDHNGFNIAPVYNAGDTMRSFGLPEDASETSTGESRFNTTRAAYVPQQSNGNRTGNNQ